MKFLSICSGIEAASVAFEPLGWEAVGFSEIDKFPCELLAHHYPDVPNYGDMSKFEEWPDMNIDLLCGGTPCQAFSVAGKRGGMSDERGNLSLTFCRIADRYQPKWVLWENVPGVLSDKDNAFGCFLAELCGAESAIKPVGGRWPNAGMVDGRKRSAAWRVIDAQYFGVAQRRRRVFVLAVPSTGERSVASVLFVGKGLPRHTAPSRSTGEGIASGAETCVGSGCFEPVSKALKGNSGGIDREDGHTLIAHTLQTTCHDYSRADGFNMVFEPQGCDVYNGEITGQTAATLTKASGGANTSGPKAVCVHGTQDPCVQEELAFAQGRNNGGENAVCVQEPVAFEPVAFEPGILKREGGDSRLSEGICSTLRSTMGDNQPAVCSTSMQVRRLTPTECERLQGFPDGYTRIPYSGKPADKCPDGPRYKALGNSWAVPCARWIAERIEREEAYLKEQSK